MIEHSLLQYRYFLNQLWLEIIHIQKSFVEKIVQNAKDVVILVTTLQFTEIVNIYPLGLALNVTIL